MMKKRSKSPKKHVKVQTLPTTEKKLSKEEAKKLKGGVDPSGNTVYVSGASGGIWKTTTNLKQ